MNSKINNPLLKQLISEIANKAKEGRISTIGWQGLYESKNIIKQEADQKKGGEPDAAPDGEKGGAEGEAAGAAPSGGEQAGGVEGGNALDAAGGGEGGPADAGAEGGEGGAAGADPLAGAEDPAAGGEEGASEEDAEKAQADAAKAKAELEKAKAEKDQAEKELENQSYIKLKSGFGVRFLLGKILGQAFKTNTIDALAAEMIQKLNIKTQDDVNSFSQDVAPLKALPGMPALLASMKAMAEKQPSTSSEEGGE